MSEEKKELSPEIKACLKKGFDLEWRKEARKAVPVKERTKIPREHMP